jgi:hypothetical protein
LKKGASFSQSCVVFHVGVAGATLGLHELEDLHRHGLIAGVSSSAVVGNTQAGTLAVGLGAAKPKQLKPIGK